MRRIQSDQIRLVPLSAITQARIFAVSSETACLFKAILLAVVVGISIFAFFDIHRTFGQENSAATYEQIRISKGEEGESTLYRGTITDFNAIEIVIVVGDGSRTRKFPTEKVVETKPIYLASHEDALSQISQADYSSAFTSLDEALVLEKREWVRRELMALQLKLLQRTDQLTTRSQLFTQLLASDRDTRFFHLIPLLWINYNLPAAELSLARQYLDNDEEAMQLIGASWLLSGAGRSAALQKLEELTQSIEPAIAQLATAQLWRAQVLTAKTPDVERWLTLLEKMPQEFRFGPLLIVGSARAQLAPKASDKKNWVDQTVTMLLRIPILYPDHFQESAESLVVAGRLLESHQRDVEAKKIYSELINEFPQTSAAERALTSPLVGDGK